MFSYTKKEVVMLAQELNVQKQTLERVLRLIDVLKFINTETSIINNIFIINFNITKKTNNEEILY